LRLDEIDFMELALSMHVVFLLQVVNDLDVRSGSWDLGFAFLWRRWKRPNNLRVLVAFIDERHRMVVSKGDFIPSFHYARFKAYPRLVVKGKCDLSLHQVWVLEYHFVPWSFLLFRFIVCSCSNEVSSQPSDMIDSLLIRTALVLWEETASDSWVFFLAFLAFLSLTLLLLLFLRHLSSICIKDLLSFKLLLISYFLFDILYCLLRDLEERVFLQ
jgi:hypothetical protein